MTAGLSQTAPSAGPGRPKATSGPTRRVAEILECLGRNEPMRLSEIATRLGQAKSTTLAVLTTLAAYGFVVRDRHDRYALGIRLIAVASGAARGAGLGHESHEVLRALSREPRMTANIGVLSDHHIVYVDKVQDYSSAIQLVTFVGGTLPAHATAMGKVLVAELPPDEREKWIEEHCYETLNERTITSAAAMRREIAFYRAEG
jgi:DNA-binding IclR family transcriptional regulator